MTRVPYKVLAAIVFTLLVIALWQAAVETGVANRLFVAAPAQRVRRHRRARRSRQPVDHDRRHGAAPGRRLDRRR